MCTCAYRRSDGFRRFDFPRPCPLGDGNQIRENAKRGVCQWTPPPAGPALTFGATGVILSQQGLTLSGFREASAVDVDAGELISRGGWSVVYLPALGRY